MAQHVCSKCGKELANRHSLSRHKKTYCKTSHVGDRQERLASTLDADVIPTFDGSEFDNGKPKSNETLARMEQLYVPKTKDIAVVDNDTSSVMSFGTANKISQMNIWTMMYSM